MKAAVESYLALRRVAGFTLSNDEYLLRSFADFAAEHKQTQIYAATAIEWASQARSLAQRHARYQTICHFAQFLRVEDPRHESLPSNYSATGKRAVCPTFIHAMRSPILFSPPRAWFRPTRCCPRRMPR